jgi:hypothetical protein
MKEDEVELLHAIFAPIITVDMCIKVFEQHSKE